MNDPAASGRGIRQRFSFKSRSQRDAGLCIYVRWVGLAKTWHDVSNPHLRLVAGYETHWWELKLMEFWRKREWKSGLAGMYF